MKSLKNLLNDKILAPSNLLRALGIVTGKALTGPLKVSIDITNKCDMGCIMCPYHSANNNKGLQSEFMMPLERLKSLIREFRRLQVKTVMLCGEGDPLLYDHIEEIIEFMRQSSIGVEIITNAYYLNKAKVDYFKKVGVKKILVSLHAADAQTFSKIRPLKTAGDFNTVMENLYYLKHIRSLDRGLRLYIINVVSHLNYDKIIDMVRLAEDFKADKVILRPVELAAGHPEYLRLTQAEIKYIIEEFHKGPLNITVANNIGSFLNYLRHSQSSRSTSSEHQNFPVPSIECHMPWTHSAICLDGSVIGCVHSSRCHLGNIYESSFKDIWYNRKYNNFRKGLYCPGICPGKSKYPLLF
jgi:MoaA/NifB/PqqE/SkfB family radical SAM enzyme